MKKFETLIAIALKEFSEIMKGNLEFGDSIDLILLLMLWQNLLKKIRCISPNGTRDIQKRTSALAFLKSMRTRFSHNYILLSFTNTGRQMSAFIYLRKIQDKPNLVWWAENFYFDPIELVTLSLFEKYEIK